ncbi:MAG: SIMPL domain-containing protein [Candidatus Zixiibacteriota bacterium]
MASFLLGLAVVISTLIVTKAFVKVKAFGQTITVTGSASKPIRSNRGLWEGTVSVTAANIEEAYSQLKSHLAKTEAFLGQEGFQQGQYEIGAVQIAKNMNREGVLTGYSLRQTLKVALDDIDRVTSLSRTASSLVEAGIEFYSGSPRYLFTGLDALKIDMIRAATENAKLRAHQLAEITGRKVGAPASARVGVFQIRALNSQEVSDMGMSDERSIDKEIVSTVTVSFLFE